MCRFPSCSVLVCVFLRTKLKNRSDLCSVRFYHSVVRVQSLFNVASVFLFAKFSQSSTRGSGLLLYPSFVGRYMHMKRNKQLAGEEEAVTDRCARRSSSSSCFNNKQFTSL